MDISGAITSDLYIEDILKLIVMVTAKVTGFEICSLWLLDESTDPPKIRLKAAQAIDLDYIKDRSLELTEGVVGYVATINRPLIIENVLEEPRFKEKDMARKLGLVSHVERPVADPGRQGGGRSELLYDQYLPFQRNRGQSGQDRGQPGRRRNHEHRTDGQNPGHPGGTGDPEACGTGPRRC